jgi:cyclopropane-fatty-acyl-phospholipid synthase
MTTMKLRNFTLPGPQLPSIPKLTLAQVVDLVVEGELPVRFTAYDGSSTGKADSPYAMNLKTPRGTTYLATAPGDLGLARAYISGDLDLEGVHPGDPYGLLHQLGAQVNWRRPTATEMALIARSIGRDLFRPVAPPPQEHIPRWQRIANGLVHSKGRDAEAIQHHYDVSNEFYAHVLGPSMTYTCAKYPSADATLEEAQEAKYQLVFDKLGLREGDRLLDVGCGWGSMVRFAARRGVRVIGATLSRAQAEWAQKAIADEGLAEWAEVRHTDYRDVPESGFDAVSSIGLTEHIGVENYPSYFAFLRGKLRPGGRLLNHCITRTDTRADHKTGAFIDRYVFPDGELAASGRIISDMQDAGFEVRHAENLREHYAMTLRDWCANLEKHWDECVALSNEGTNAIQLHQVLAVRNLRDGDAQVPLNQWW